MTIVHIVAVTILGGILLLPLAAALIAIRGASAMSRWEEQQHDAQWRAELREQAARAYRRRREAHHPPSGHPWDEDEVA